tara:strand:- start:277 stop:510 length:234 start_codon:yes stop_codon:yes gene_type:complete
MKIRGVPGHFELHPENDKEHNMIGQAMRESEKHFAQFAGEDRQALFYWGDTEPSDLEATGKATFILATWDARDYEKE